MVCRNLWILVILHTLHNSLFGLPVVYVYLSEKGYSLQEFFVLPLVFNLVSVILELYTGWIADRWSRRLCAFLASLFLAAGWSCYCFGDNLWWFMGAEALMATALSFRSGTFEALSFDSCVDAGRPDRTRIDGRKLFCLGYTVQAVACLIGGALFHWSPFWTFCLSLPFLAASIGVSLFLKEPLKDRARAKGFLETLGDCRNQLSMKKHRPLRAMLAFYAVVTGLMMSLAWCTQPYQKDIVHIPVSYGAPIYAAVLLIHAILARVMQSWEERYDVRILFGGCILLLLAGIWMAGMFPSLLGLLGLLMGRSCFGAITPATTDLCHRATEAQYKVTVFSLRTLLSRFVFCCLVILIEVGLLFLDLPSVLRGLGVVGVFLVAVTVIYYRREWVVIAEQGLHPHMNAGLLAPGIPKIGVVKQKEVETELNPGQCPTDIERIGA